MNNWITTFLLLIPFLLSAQNGTTLEEYRFLSKGYAYQKSMGLDASKTGYDIKAIGPLADDVEYIGLYIAGQSTPQAILLVLQSNTAEPTYLCIPNNLAINRVMELHEIDRQQITDSNVWKIYDKAMRQLTFHLLGKDNSLSNTALAETLIEKPVSGEVNELEKTKIEEPILITSGVTADSPVTEYDFTQKGSSKIESTDINTSVVINLDEQLTQRGVLQAPVIKGKYAAKGKVAIKFCVDKNGDVSSAKFTQLGSTTFNKALINKSIEGVKESTFAKSENIECGKVVFHFR